MDKKKALAAILFGLFAFLPLMQAQAATSFGNFGMILWDTGDLDYVNTYNGNLQIIDATLFNFTTSGFLVTLSSLSISTASLQVEVDALNLTTFTLMFQIDGSRGMTGPLTLFNSTVTVGGDAFSIGGSTLVVKNGLVGFGTLTPGATAHVEGSFLVSDLKNCASLSTDGSGKFSCGPAPGTVDVSSHVFITDNTNFGTDCTVQRATATISGSSFTVTFAGSIGSLVGGAANNWGLCILVDGASAPGLTCASSYAASTMVVADEVGRSDVKPIAFSYIIDGLEDTSHTFALTACTTNSARFEARAVNQFGVTKN